MTDEQIKEIRARADAATQGKWEVYEIVDAHDEDDDPEDFVYARGMRVVGGAGLNKGEDIERFDKADAAFIAAAREDVPALCDALAARDQRIAELVKLLRDIDDENDAAKGMQDAALYSSGSDLDSRVRKALAGGAS